MSSIRELCMITSIPCSSSFKVIKSGRSFSLERLDSNHPRRMLYILKEAFASDRVAEPLCRFVLGVGVAVVPQINKPRSRRVITPDIVSKPAEMLPLEFVAPVALSPAEAWHSQQ